MYRLVVASLVLAHRFVSAVVEPIESEEEKARRAANAVQYEQTYDGVPYELKTIRLEEIIQPVACQVALQP